MSFPSAHHTMPPSAAQDELTETAVDALKSLSDTRKASLLLETAQALIDAGRYGEEVERYLDVYLRTSCLSKADRAQALILRANARRISAEKLLGRAQLDLQAVAQLDPSNYELQMSLRRGQTIHLRHEPASLRVPPEIWEHIARFIPRFHLRTWFFVSSFYRNIALRIIFRTLDLYFGDDQDTVHRGLDILDRVKADAVFASRIKTLRVHWSYEEGDMLDLMARLFRTALPAFTAIQDFEWIGYPEMRAEMVQAVLASHPHLRSLGLIGWHFDAVGVSAFRNLQQFVLRAEDDDGFADMGEVRTVLDQNEGTLRHLTLGAYLKRQHSWDSAFGSATIRNLTHLDLVDTRISHLVLARIAHAQSLRSLTLHGTFEEPTAARVVFASDHVIGGAHTFLPHLEAFRFVLVGHDDDFGLFQAVTQFLRQRPRLRRLDLGSCPWELVQGVLPDLKSLRVLRVRIANLNESAIESLLRLIPQPMVAIHLAVVVSDKPLNEYTPLFRRFTALAMLHLHAHARRRPQANMLKEKDFRLQTEEWAIAARSLAVTLPSLDFVGWHGEHYVVVRTGALHERVELKELPVRRRLDCGNGVDLGSEDAAWMERKDVPMDYEMPGLES